MSYRWISKRAVIAIHNEQLAQHGGLTGIRDEALLDSALAKSQNCYTYEQATLSRCAAAYSFGITRKHPFNDGNKRTGFVTAATFLLLNNHYVRVSEKEVVEVISALAAGELKESELIEWFGKITIPVKD